MIVVKKEEVLNFACSRTLMTNASKFEKILAGRRGAGPALCMIKFLSWKMHNARFGVTARAFI